MEAVKAENRQVFTLQDQKQEGCEKRSFQRGAASHQDQALFSSKTCLKHLRLIQRNSEHKTRWESSLMIILNEQATNKRHQERLSPSGISPASVPLIECQAAFWFWHLKHKDIFLLC